jgi:hypothetical protein
VALRAEGSIEQGQSRIKAESILQGLAAIRAVHVARFLPTTAFDNPSVKLAIQDQDTMIESSGNDPAPTLTPTQRRRPRDTSEGLSEKAIIPTNAPYATRSSVKNSHVIDILRNTEDPLFPLYSAFSVLQDRPSIHGAPRFMGLLHTRRPPHAVGSLAPGSRDRPSTRKINIMS